MTSILEIYDASGNVIFDNSRVTRFQATINFYITTTSPVNFSYPGIAPNSDWIVVPRITGTGEGLIIDIGNMAIHITLLQDIIQVQCPHNYSFTSGYLTIMRY